jgi:pyrrolidone-carboxylate peptidase
MYLIVNLGEVSLKTYKSALPLRNLIIQRLWQGLPMKITQAAMFYLGRYCCFLPVVYGTTRQKGSSARVLLKM